MPQETSVRNFYYVPESLLITGTDHNKCAADFVPPKFYVEDYKSVSAKGEDMRSGGKVNDYGYVGKLIDAMIECWLL